MIFEIDFSPRLTRFCDRWMTLYCDKWLTRYCEYCDKWRDELFCGDDESKNPTHPTFHEKMWKCSNLKELSLTRVHQAVIEEKSAARMFHNFPHLTTLLLVPDHV